MNYHHDEENFFTLAIERVDPADCHVNFKIYEIVSLGPTPNDHSYGPHGQLSFEAVMDGHVDPEIRGSIKWDGCSNFFFSSECFHYCSKEQAQKIGVMLGRAYDEAKLLLADKWFE
jgi:hypothetical protein